MARQGPVRACARKDVEGHIEVERLPVRIRLGQDRRPARSLECGRPRGNTRAPNRPTSPPAIRCRRAQCWPAGCAPRPRSEARSSRPSSAAAHSAPWATPASASIASAATTRKGTAARRCLFAEVHVIVDGRIERIGVQLHFLARQHIALPRLDSQGAAARRWPACRPPCTRRSIGQGSSSLHGVNAYFSANSSRSCASKAAASDRSKSDVGEARRAVAVDQHARGHAFASCRTRRRPLSDRNARRRSA